MTKRKKEKSKLKAEEAVENTRSGLHFAPGSIFQNFNDTIFRQTIDASWFQPDITDKDRERVSGYAIVSLVGIGPRNEIEGMLAAQMIAAHNAAMECYRRAMIPEQSFEGRQQSLAFADKLSRTYTMQMEALQRYRGKGQQKVTVEHVHVHPGGKAIVGNVEQPAGAPGAETKTKEQPHAKQLEYSPPLYAQIPAMPRKDEEKELVSISGNAERAMPDARRHVDRRSEGK